MHSDAGAVSEGRWPLLAPWLHTYALPVFAVLSVLVAIGWGAVRDWLADVEDYAAATFARAIRIMRRSGPLPARRTPPTAERAPRRLFGLAFESRPPPLRGLTPATLSLTPRVAVVRPCGGGDGRRVTARRRATRRVGPGSVRAPAPSG